MSIIFLAVIRQWIDGPGTLAQLGEHLLCKQGVVGSSPISSTIIMAE